MVVDLLLGLGLALPITAGVGIGAVTGVAQGVSHQQKANEEAKNANPESRMVKFHIDARVDSSLSSTSSYKRLHGSIVVLRDDKLWLEAQGEDGTPVRKESHLFTGFYVQYPDGDRVPPVRGLVSTISVDPPMLNWVYADKETYELKYSNRSGSIEHIVGEWDWTDEFEDSCLSFDGWEPFVAVEEKDKLDEEGRPRWALYVDVDDDGLRAKKKGKRTVEVQLERRPVTNQEFNKWGIGQQGNIGFKTTKEVDKIAERKEQREREEKEERERLKREEQEATERQESGKKAPDVRTQKGEEKKTTGVKAQPSEQKKITVVKAQKGEEKKAPDIKPQKSEKKAQDTKTQKADNKKTAGAKPQKGK